MTSAMWHPLEPAETEGRQPTGLIDGETFVQAWTNDVYTVWEYEMGAWTHLSIKRTDKKPIHDWRHLQQIKNEICGEDREAVELYPASFRVLDVANQYHLWVLPKGKHMQIGTWDRAVSGKALGVRAKQRPFERGITI